MRLRPVQIVCLAILLSSMRMANASALPPLQRDIQGPYLALVVGHDGLAVWTEIHLSDLQHLSAHVQVSPASAARPRYNLAMDLAPASLAHARTPWTLKPPSAQYLALQSVTGFGDPSPLPTL